MYSVCFLGIVQPPQPLNVTLNQPPANLTCAAVADFSIIWIIDGYQEDSCEVKERRISVLTTEADPVTGIRNSTLTIPAIEDNNDTKVKCTAANPPVESDEVSFKIQGMQF